MKKLTLTLPAAILLTLAVAFAFTWKDYAIGNRTTTIQSVIYFPADTALMVEFHSVDTDTSGTEWHSTRSEKIFLKDSTAAEELEEIGGSAKIIGEALRTNYGLN